MNTLSTDLLDIGYETGGPEGGEPVFIAPRMAR